MSITITIIAVVLIIALGVGLGAGWWLANRAAKLALVQARLQATATVEQAQQEAAKIHRVSAEQNQTTIEKIRQAVGEQVQQAEESNKHLEERLQRLESRNLKQEAQLATREAAALNRETAVNNQREEAKSLSQQAKEKHESERAILEEKAGRTAAQIRDHFAESLIEETRAQCADRLRNLESSAGEEYVRMAKRVIGISIGRYRRHFLGERVSSLITLPPGGAAKLREGEGYIESIEKASSTRLSFSDDDLSVRVEGADGAGRELARRAVTRFLEEEKIRDPERLVSFIFADLEREIIKAGKDAFRMLDVQLAQPELVKLVGRLNFRTSYTQNQWQHAIESAFIGGLIAAELGLDVMTARRASLLHDIGKALTHEIEGSHAVIGADLARKNGEAELIANAIGAHHGDEEPQSPYAYIVAAADAMSGARPGARREMTETYVDRISELEKIAGNFNGVQTVHAVQAGRELRIHVDEMRVNDQRAAQLSEDIARKISDDMVFPGQIRVTVIREFRSIQVTNS